MKEDGLGGLELAAYKNGNDKLTFTLLLLLLRNCRQKKKAGIQLPKIQVLVPFRCLDVSKISTYIWIADMI